MPRPFLTARWSNLCLFTFAVPPALLRPRVPPGLMLDTRDSDAFVSLVAFDFLDTRVLGVRWAGYRNFPEINLRFYVRDGNGPDARRGVVFIREFVPQRLVAFLARAIYNEPYSAARMSSRITENADRITVEHRLRAGGRTNTLRVTGGKPAACPGPDSVEHFFKEHQWGYGTTRAGRCLQYEVAHPHWDCFGVIDYALDWDWDGVYGPEFRVLHGATPCSVILAKGSDVAVYPKGRPAGV